VPIDAAESDEGETKDSDGAAPTTSAPAVPSAESTTTISKSKKSKKSKKKRKKKAASGHSSVCIYFKFSY